MMITGGKQYIFILIACITLEGYTQKQDCAALWKNKEQSIFSNINTGTFAGSANGFVQLMRRHDTLLLDFNAAPLALGIEKEAEEIYDNAYRTYTTHTTSGKTKLEYKIYALANVLTIVLDGEHYSTGVIDGACATPVTGINFYYGHENETEYLSLYISKNISLGTTRYLAEQKGMSYADAEKQAKTITLLAGSSLILQVNK